MTSKVASRPRVVLVNRAIILNDEGKILLIRRSDRDCWQAGRWEFPGGKIDEGQDTSDALEREVLEEAGLVVTPVNRIAYYESRILVGGKYDGLPYIILVGIARVTGGKEVRLSEEHSGYAWVDADEALSYDLTSESRKALLVLKDTLPK